MATSTQNSKLIPRFCVVSLLSLLGACGGAELSQPPAIPLSSASVEKNTASSSSSPAITYPVYRFAKYESGAYFYTGSADEAQFIRQNLSSVFRDEGIAFFGVTGGKPVYRFANINNGGYFFTGSEEEKNSVIASYPNLRFEGSSFSVADPLGTIRAKTVFRLANKQNGAYLLTSNIDEVDYALTLPYGGETLWRYEGSSFSVPESSGEVAKELTPSIELTLDKNYDVIKFTSIAGLSGDTVVAWQAKSLLSTSGNKIAARGFIDNSWGPEIQVSDVNANATNPIATRDVAGNVWIIWTDYNKTTGNSKLIGRRFSSGQWGNPLTLWEQLSNSEPKVFDVVSTGKPTGTADQQFFHFAVEYSAFNFLFNSSTILREANVTSLSGGSKRRFVVAQPEPTTTITKWPECPKYLARYDAIKGEVSAKLVFVDSRNNYIARGPWVAEFAEPNGLDLGGWQLNQSRYLSTKDTSSVTCPQVNSQNAASYFSASVVETPIIWADLLESYGTNYGLYIAPTAASDGARVLDRYYGFSLSANDNGISLISGDYQRISGQNFEPYFFTLNKDGSRIETSLNVSTFVSGFSRPIATLGGQKYQIRASFTSFPAPGENSLTVQLDDLSQPSAPQTSVVNADTVWLGGSGIQITVIYPDGTTRTGPFNQFNPVVVADRKGRLTIVWEQPTVSETSANAVANRRSTLHVRRLQ
jgi:Repeat of unknown function (DUF5648)